MAVAAILRGIGMGLGYGTGIIPLVNLFSSSGGLNKGEVHYRDFYNVFNGHKELPFGDLPSPVSVNGKETKSSPFGDETYNASGFKGQDFSGVIRDTNDFWNGKHLNVITRKGPNFTLALTSISDIKSVSEEIRRIASASYEDAAKYKLTAYDLPFLNIESKQFESDGFHLLVTCSKEGQISSQAAVLLKADAKKYIGEMLTELGEQCTKAESAEQAVRWVSSEGKNYSSYL